MNNKINQMMQQMQTQLSQMQKNLKNKVVESSAGGGMVQISINANQEIQKIKINKELLNGQDPENLEDILISALNEAIRQSKQEKQTQLSSLTGGLPLPPSIMELF